MSNPFEDEEDEENYDFTSIVVQNKQQINETPVQQRQQQQLSLDSIASYLIKNNFILTALELHSELAENGRELSRLRDYFSNPANFEHQQQQSSAGFPLHKTPSIQTFDSLDLTRYSDDIENQALNNNLNNSNPRQDETKVAILEFELRKAKETINQLRNTLTIATENSDLLTVNVNSSRVNNTQTPNAAMNSTIINQNELTPVAGKTRLNLNKTTPLLLPHEKNAINFLINEYLLSQNYKMTSVTFSEENESQDLEDWDVVGLNRSKPPNLINIYKSYANNGFAKPEHDPMATPTVENNTNLCQKVDAMTNVNFDFEFIETQKSKVDDLNEKKEVLLNKIQQLEIDIENLNSERETFIKKIDLLTNLNNDLRKTVSSLKEEREHQHTHQNEQSTEPNKYETFKFERKISIIYKETLSKYMTAKLNEENEKIVKEMTFIRSNYDDLIRFLAKNLPNIVANVQNQKRIDLLPLIVYAAVLQESSNDRDSLLKLLFSLIKKPDYEQRSVILAGCVCFAKQAGPDRANNELLPQFWEQITNKHEEMRCMVAESCAQLAPYMAVDIRSSLILSIVKQILLQDKSEEVRLSATKSLGVLINYIQDEDKFKECLELLDNCLNDVKEVRTCANMVLVPSLALWALQTNKLNEPFINSYITKIDKLIKSNFESNKETVIKTYANLLQYLCDYIYACMLFHMQNEILFESQTDNDSTTTTSTNSQQQYVSTYYFKYRKSSIVSDLYNLEMLFDTNFDSIVKSFQNFIVSNDMELNKWPFYLWIQNDFLKRLVQSTTHIDAQSELTDDFIQLFKHFSLLFGRYYIETRIMPLFNEYIDFNEEALNVSLKSDTSAIYSAMLPVYFIGVLNVCYVNYNSNNSVNSSGGSASGNGAGGGSVGVGGGESSSYHEHQDHDNVLDDDLKLLNNYLKRLLIAFSLSQSNLNSLYVIYNYMSKNKQQSCLQILLSTLWDGIVHDSLYVRCYTAKLFETLIKNIDENTLSHRVLPALITLANDPEKAVKCESISALCSVVESCTNKDVFERVYIQMQSFINDPLLKEDYYVKREFIKAFKRVLIKIDNKFREEFILPSLKIFTLQIIQAQHSVLPLDDHKCLEISCLLFETYNMACCCTISRLAVQEHLIPGLYSLKQILQQDPIHLDRVKTVDTLITEFETKHHIQHNDLLNTSISSTSSSNTPQQTATIENNFKYLFKGITNSKDKFSNFLSTKKHVKE